MEILLYALWFFLPAGVANAAPVLASRLPYLRRWDAPMDGNHSLRGKRLFGPHKTWRGLLSGVVAACLVVYIQQLIIGADAPGFLNGYAVDYLYYSPFLLGFLFGLGALLGDALESAIKRQKNIEAGDPWFPFDQTDYIVGGCLAMAVVVRLSAVEYAAILTVWLTLHLIFSYAGYRAGLKEKPI